MAKAKSNNNSATEKLEVLKTDDIKEVKSNAIIDFFRLFIDIFKYSISGIKIVFGAIFKPFSTIFLKKEVIENIDIEDEKKSSANKEESNSFWAKLWKIKRKKTTC